MSVHEEKIEVLKGKGNDLRKAINADMENLRFKLCDEGLISDEARESRDAGKMVAEIQNRLHGDEAVWDKLLAVLGKIQLRENLSRALSEKTGTNQERPPIEKRTARKFKNNQKF